MGADDEVLVGKTKNEGGQMGAIELDPIFVALITAAATIISAFISAVVARNGIAFWDVRRRYKLIGTGKDLRSVSWRGEVLDHATPFKYALKNGTLEIKGEKSTLKATILVYKEDGTDVAHGVLTASGINEGGVVHMSYRINDPDSTQHWQGVLLLRIANLGDINGLWISDSAADPGWCTFGSLAIERRSA